MVTYEVYNAYGGGDQVNQFLMREQFQDVNISKDQCHRTKGYNIALLLQ
jgi:hypothetical protein